MIRCSAPTQDNAVISSRLKASITDRLVRCILFLRGANQTQVNQTVICLLSDYKRPYVPDVPPFPSLVHGETVALAGRAYYSLQSKRGFPNMKRYSRLLAHFVLLSFCLTPFNLCARGRDITPQKSIQGPQDILRYISNGWDVLTRSMTKCETVSDPKTLEKSVVYLPAGFPVPPAVQAMQKNCT